MTDLTTDDLTTLLAAATPGPWHHCQPYKTVPAVRTVHGPVPAQRVDYVSTWPHPGTPKGHRIIIPMEGNPANVRSADMALIARAPDLAAEVIRLRQENETLRERVTTLWEATNAARAALEDKT